MYDGDFLYRQPLTGTGDGVGGVGAGVGGVGAGVGGAGVGGVGAGVGGAGVGADRLHKACCNGAPFSSVQVVLHQVLDR